MKLRQLLVVAALGAIPLVAAGCPGPEQGSKGPDREEIKQMIRTELMRPEFKKTVQDSLAKEDIRAMIVQTVESPDGQRVVRKTVAKEMDSDEIRMKVDDSVKKALQSPNGKQSIDQAVQASMQQILMKASSQGAGSKSGASGGGGQ